MTTLKYIEPKSITVFDFINRGAYGIVCMGNWSQYRKPPKVVAIKFISDDESFSKEEQCLANIKHENIVTIFGKSTWRDGKQMFIMEYADYGCLYNVLHDSNYNGCDYLLSHAIGWCLQCSRGVRYLHNQKPKPLLHRDLKSGNLLLFNNGRNLKICDFGTARSSQTTMTENIGTFRWMAPEVFKTKHYTVQCDVYSWAIILWEVLTRHRPFHNTEKNGDDTILQFQISVHNKRPSRFASRCPPELNQLLTSAWNGDPKLRPTMNEIVEKMKHFQTLIFTKNPAWFNLPFPFHVTEEDWQQSENTTKDEVFRWLAEDGQTSQKSPSSASSSSSSNQSTTSNRLPMLLDGNEELNEDQQLANILQTQFLAYRCLGKEPIQPNISRIESINLHCQYRMISVKLFRQCWETYLLKCYWKELQKIVAEQQQPTKTELARTMFSIQYSRTLIENNRRWKQERKKLIEKLNPQKPIYYKSV